MPALELALLAAGFALIGRSLARWAEGPARERLRESATRRARELRGEFVPVGPEGVLRFLVASAALMGLCGALAARSLWISLPAAAIPLFASGVAVRLLRKRRRERLVSQLPAFLDLLAGYLKAGRSLPEGMSDVLTLLPREIREEVSWVLQMYRLGTPLGEALELWEDRMSREEFSLALRPLRVALPVGGNVLSLLEGARDILRQRERNARRRRALTAQGRLQAVALTLLPAALVAALSLVDPWFLPRLTGTPAGRAILALSATLTGIAWIAIRKILGPDR